MVDVLKCNRTRLCIQMIAVRMKSKSTKTTKLSVCFATEHETSFRLNSQSFALSDPYYICHMTSHCENEEIAHVETSWSNLKRSFVHRKLYANSKKISV